MMRLSRAMAGVAMHISSSVFLPSSLNSLPACITNVEQSEFGKRRGNDDRRHAAQLPEEVAVQIVGANSHGSRGDQLGALAAVPDVGRGPVALLVPLDAPDLLAGLLVEGEQEGLVVV